MSLFDDIANGFRQMFGGGNNNNRRPQAQSKPHTPQYDFNKSFDTNFNPSRDFSTPYQMNNDEEERRERERKRREEEERRRQAEEARQREAERKKQEAERLRQTTQKKPGFFDYLNPLSEHGLFGAKQQQTFKQGIKPVNDVLQNYEKFIDKSDRQEGFQWNDIGDYLRFVAKLPTGMVSGPLNAPEKIAQAISGVRNNDNDEVERINLLQRGATALDAGIDIGGLGFGGSGTLLKSLGKEVAKETAKKGIKQTIKSIAKDALQEGIEEGTQTFLGDLSDDGKLNADLNQYVQSVALGALGGGLMSGAGKSISSVKQAYLRSPQAKLDNQIAQRMATDPKFAEAVAQRKQEIRQAMLEARDEAVQEQVTKKSLTQTVTDAYHDGKLPIPRTELTPNAGRNARMRQAIDNAPISEPFNYGRVSKDTLAQHNDIQAQTGQDFVKNRDVTVYPNAHNAHVEKRIHHERVSPDDYVKIAEKAIYGKNKQLLPSPSETGIHNVMYANTDNPSGRVMMGNFNDGLSLKSVQQINDKRLDADIKKAQAKLGTPLVDDDSQAVSRAVSSLDSAKGMNPIDNPLGTRDLNIAQSDQNVNQDVKTKIADASNQLKSSIDELKARHFKLTGDNDIAFNAFAEAIQDIGNIEGYYDPKTNTVHIGELAEYVLNHEVVHKTLRKHMELRPEILQATADKFGIDNIIAEYNQKGYGEQAVNGHTLDAKQPKDVRLAVEEKLADEFNTYLEQYQKGRANYYANKVGLTPTVRAWFDRIIEGLKEFFGRADQIKQFYAQLETGKFSTDGNIGALEKAVSRLEDSVAYKRSPDAAKRALAGFKMVQNGWRKQATLTQLTAETAEKYRQVTGLSVKDDARLILTGDTVNHLRNSGHLTGQGIYGRNDTNPLTDADMANIHEVFNNPDQIKVVGDGRLGKRLSVTKMITKNHQLGVDLISDGFDFYVVTYFNKSRSPQQVQASSSEGVTEPNPLRPRPERSSEAYGSSISQANENVKFKLSESAQEASDFYYNDHQSPAEMRQELINRLWEANKKGQGVDHIFHEAENALDDTYMVRASNNSPFYSAYFEANGKKPTKAGITAIVDEILGIQNDRQMPTVTSEMWQALAWEYGDLEGITDAYKRLEQKRQSRQEKEKRMLESIIAESNSIKQELPQDPTPIKQVIKQKQDSFNNTPLENKNHAYTKGNLYAQTTIGSSEDVVRGGGAENGRRFMFGDWEMRQHTRKKNGKSFTQVERRYIDPETGEAGDWKPYSRAAYIWHTQSKKIDQVNRDQLIQEALTAAKQDGEVREFVAKTTEKGGTAVEPLTGNKTIDGGLVRDPVSGEVEGNYIQVTPFGVVNQVAGKFHLIEIDQIIANNSDRKPKPSIFDTYMRTVEKTAANSHSKQTQQDLYYKKTKAYANFVKNKEEVLNEHTKQANTLESYRPTDVKAKQFWEDVGRYTENTFPAIEDKNQKEAFAQKYGEETAQAVERYSQYMRQQYDALIEQANAVRRIYGKDEIPHRKNYMPHMTKDGGLLGMVPAEIAANLRGEMETTGRGEIPANIAGLSETFKPTKKYNKHEMRRKRKDASDYELDPRKVFEKYTDLVLYNTHMEPIIAEGRQLETAMRVVEHDASKEILDPLSALKQSKAKVSSRQTIAVMDFVNAMAGKSNALDRAFIDRATEGMKRLRRLENINGANKIMGNISSTLAQALNLSSTIRDNGVANTGKAVLRAFSPEVKTAMKKSAFLAERYADGGEKFSKTKWQNFSSGVSKMTGMDLVESAFIRLAWGANYQRLKSQGIKGFDLIKQTDLATERSVGGRGIGAMPQAYQSALGKIFLQFTYETNETFKNDMEHVKGIVKGLKAKDYKKAGGMTMRGAEAMVTAMVLNAIYKQVTGNEPLPDLLGATIKAGANATKDDDDETKENVVRNVVGNVGTEFIKANPIASAMVNMWPKSDRQEIFGHDSDFGRFDGATGVAQTSASLGKGVFNLLTGEKDKAVQNMVQVLPMGSQLRKTANGASALLKGAVTKKDKNGDEQVVYEVDNKNPINIIKGLAFGKNALNETQAHYQAKDSQNAGGKIMSANSNLLKSVEKQYGKESVQYVGLKEAMERKKANRDNAEYKSSVRGITDDMRIKLARGELIQDKAEDGGLLRTRDGGIAKEFYKKLAKAESKPDVFKEYINSDEGMKFEYLEAQREYDKAMKEGSLSKKEQIKKRQELTKMQVQSDWRKEYRDAYSLTGSYQDTQGIYALYGDAKDEVRQKLNEINDAMFKAKLITQKTYDKRYENINEINKPKRGRGGRKSTDDSFSVPKLPGYRVTGAPEFQRTTKKGKGIVKGLKLTKSGGVEVSPLPRAKIISR